MASTLRLRKEKLAAYRRIAGITTDQELARRLGMRPSTVSRVLHGTQEPGHRFIAGMVDIFGVDLFADLFELVGATPDVDDERLVVPA